MPDQGQTQSSLRQAVDRILGFSPGGQQQQSDFQLAAKPMMSDISNLSNTDWSKSLGTLAAATNPAPAAPVYSMYDTANIRPGGQVAVGLASNTNTPWKVLDATSMNDPEVRAQIQRSYDQAAANYTSLSSMNTPDNANYNNPNIGISQNQMDVYGKLLQV